LDLIFTLITFGNIKFNCKKNYGDSLSLPIFLITNQECT
jgi:hypothetical protein